MDDIDSLLDFEADLFEEENASRKRRVADIASQRDAVASLGTDAKRPRAATTIDSAIDDEELLELALRGYGGQENAAPKPFASGAGLSAAITGTTTNASQHSNFSGRKPVPHQNQTAHMDNDELDALLEIDPSQMSAFNKEGTRLPPESTVANGAAPAQEEELAAEVEEEEAQLPVRQALDTMLPLRPYAPPLRDAINVEGACLTVTSSSGERVYAPLAPAQGAFASTSKVDIAGALRRARGTLLSSKIEDLLQEVERDQFEKALAETAAQKEDEEAAAAAAAAAGEETVGLTTPGHASKKQRTASGSAGKSHSAKKEAAAAKAASSLWVEKYAPKSFLDLLSDEQINRDVVRWLKTWDTCVFGAKEDIAAAIAAKKAAAKKAYNNKKYSGGGPGAAAAGAYIENSDPHGRPEYKAILLCGPPGLGKTTLAHVVARHCGYRSVEINASDDRSGTSLTSRVLDAVQMQSVMGEKRPNCLVIDEIDGAAGGAEGKSAISALVKIITASAMGGNNAGDGGGGGGKDGGTKKGFGNSKFGGRNGGNTNDTDGAESGSDDEEQGVDVNANGGGGGGGGGRRNNGGKSAGGLTPSGKFIRGGRPVKQKLRPLMRPIICICNDLYAPVLRPLRDVCKIFHFRKPSAERLAHRLQMVCAAEGLRAEKSTLRMLAERAECDIRSCLNTLQFLSKKQKVVRQMDLSGLGVGQKDMTKGAFQVWGELLQKKKGASIIGKVNENDAQRSTRLYNMLLDFGDSELVLSGVYESLPGLRFFYIGLQRTTQVLTNLEDADIFMRCCQRSGDYSLLKYLPAPTLQVSSIVAGPERPTITWPRVGGEVRRRTASNEGLMHQWLLGMDSSTFAALGPRAVTADLLPLLPALTTPALRPVSRHLFSKDEQACVDLLVGTLLSLGLKYSLYIEDMGDDEDANAILGAAARAAAVGASAVGAPVSKDPPLQFRPPVHRLWHFRGAASLLNGGAVPRRSLPIATRQMVGHEAEMEAIRRADAAKQAAAAAINGGVAPLQIDNAAAKDAPTTTQQQAQQRTTGHVPLDLAQRLKESGRAAKMATASAKVAAKGTWLDHLRDRQYEERTAAASAAAPNGGFAMGAARFPVLYKFHEGYTNAVKRPLLMSELL